MEDDVRVAVERSFLAKLPRAARDRLIDGASLDTVRAGGATYRPASDPRPTLIVRGVIRTYFVGPDGRQVTVRYAREGDVLGVVAAAGGPAPLHSQALTDVTRLQLDAETFRELAHSDAEFGFALVEELTDTVYSLWHELAAAAFATVPQRVARHLLEIAARGQESGGGAPLVADVSQQELADLAGTVREVVARALRELRDDEIVRVSRAGIIVLDPAALAARAWPRDGGH